jgi:hypothetical protein
VDQAGNHLTAAQMRAWGAVSIGSELFRALFLFLGGYVSTWNLGFSRLLVKNPTIAICADRRAK